jgi:ABC-2 type transport system permease protein
VNIAVSGAVPALAAGAHRHGGGGFILLLIVVIVVVGVVLLVRRHRNGRQAGETTAIPVTLPHTPASDPPQEDGAIGAWRKELPHGRYGIAGLLRSEWVKLRTVRSTMWTLAVTVLVGVAISALANAVVRGHWLTMSPAKRAAFDPIGESLIGVYFDQFTIGVLGVLVMSAEYSTGTIRATFCAAPRRPPVLAAKALIFGAVALAAAEIVAFASFFLGQALLTAPAVHATIASPGALRAVSGTGLYLCVMGLLALGLATIIRHTAGAISAFTAILLLIPLIVQQLPTSLDNDLARFLPLRIGVAMVSGPAQPNTFSPWTGLAILCAYAAVFLVAGAVILVRRDA